MDIQAIINKVQKRLKNINNKKIIFIAIAIIVIATLAFPISIQVVKTIQKNKMEQQPLLQYEILNENETDEDERRI